MSAMAPLVGRVWPHGVMSSVRQDWATPTQLFKMLDREFNFQLDACADPRTATTPRWIGKAEDSLRQDAPLLAAAPDLLAACKLALGAFEQAWSIDWNELSRAIAKAEGTLKTQPDGSERTPEAKAKRWELYTLLPCR